jgi:hypothetical protein
MPKPRYRIWMIMALVAIAGLAMGVYRERKKAPEEGVAIGRARLKDLSIFVGPDRLVAIRVRHRRPSNVPYPEVAPLDSGADGLMIGPPGSLGDCPSPESASGP